MYERGAALGDVACRCKLGICFELGLGVEQDEQRAIELFNACKGYKEARLRLERLATPTTPNATSRS